MNNHTDNPLLALPWEVHEHPEHGWTIYAPDDGRDMWTICHAVDPQYGPNEDEQKEEAMRHIARCVNTHGDLLKALQGILEIGKRDMSNPKYDGYFEAAREAVAKATRRP